MTVYIGLLRGINVGGKNIIKMAELKQALTSMGLLQVKTYIQSGNIIFESGETEDILKIKIQQMVKEIFRLSVPVTIRTCFELDSIISQCPFSAEEILKAESSSKAESLYVSFLASEPSPEKIQLFDTCKSQDETYRILGRNVFLLFQNSIRNSKLANNLQKLDETATTRNWKTVNKLALLAKEMEV
ncbi:uncharacterized protein (DUF1697 family) [Mobilisporobacter senegalensis]|uniref:Uncharacterized protein (DUF1697 family) n=1 Tax=Mobilisporobacter senegalensis TaxID=1329262 RepID=A0A3N1XQM4_9FIRM|nr:DUF1697 domain-containing protein [Mobilisporobacter senegalensis]ROR27382.1 uncharacterized protein (DUF1697 family) [Mobilisporobacter senegalensis]